MRNWIEAIRSCGLAYMSKHEVGDAMEVHEAKHEWQGVELGRYLIIPVSLKLFEKISENSDSFRRFEEEVVSPFYFRLQGDWSWNLYIVFVVPELGGIAADKLNLIQRGKRYGKKMVITFEQLSDKLPTAKIPDRIGDATAANPLADWRQRLEPEGLLFCLDNFKSQPVKDYAESGIRGDGPPIAASSPAMDVSRPVGPIASVHFGTEFRPHVLAQTEPMRFAQVNLLSGPNGMGKTSVLEGIELAFTGSVQRNLLADRQSAESWNGTVEFVDQGDLPFVGTPNSEEKKQREIAYYKHKVAPRGHSQLNSAFHQYNYFSSEAVHQFCFGGSSKVDYRAAFARVIFGEQLERYEQCWKQHLDEFQSMARGLQSQRDKLVEQIRGRQAEGYPDSEWLTDRARAQVQQLNHWMKQTLFSYPIPEETASLADIGQWLQHLKPLLHQLDVAYAPLSHTSLSSKVDTIGQLNRQEQADKAELSELRTRLADWRGQWEAAADPAAWEQAVRDRRTDYLNASEERERLSRLEAEFDELWHLAEQRESRQARMRMHERIEAMETAVQRLADIDNLYGYLAEWPLSGMSMDEARASLEKREAGRLLLQAAWHRTAEQAERLKDRAGKLEIAASELKAAARHVFRLHPDRSQCPLCGHDHETAQNLAEAIDSQLLADNDELNRLIADAERYKLELEEADAGIRQLQEQLAGLEKLEAARAFLAGRNVLEDTIELDRNASPQEVQRLIVQIRDRLSEQTNALKELRRQALELDERGITVPAIEQFDRLLAALPSSGSSHELSGTEMKERLARERQRVEAKAETARSEHASVQSLYDQAVQARQAISGHIDELEKQEQRLALNLQEIDRLRQACSRLGEWNVQLSEHQSWTEWRLLFEKLLLAAGELERILEPLVLVEQQTREAAELNRRLEAVDAQLKRCEHAARVLSGLRGLADYGEEFVRSNFDAIGKLFAALHSPNEFEGLAWTADNRIEARRKGSGTTCAIHQMSTGQRTSVCLALFFVMHLVMDSAPRFLLLDEPVAHMDELNVLGLLDFLRQLAIARGTQIFFTTANPQIATLFRRKFSFLEHRFRVFHLRRDAEGPLQVHTQQFKPYQEFPVAASNE